MAEIAHKHGIPFLVDNTVATPYLVNPLKLGADIVIHSSSKYINGSSDAISGILISGGSFKWNAEKFPGMAEFKKFGPICISCKTAKRFISKYGRLSGTAECIFEYTWA